MTDDIIFETRGKVALVTLNRPRALNSLTHDMCSKLDQHLIAWESDADIHAVVIRGEGEKAFCAGGDIKTLYDGGPVNASAAVAFFHDEYLCNSRLAHFSKPYISFLDGIVMGGGFGVSVHGSHRIATEKSMFAMPETGIGLIPDVGGSYFLSRCPGSIGMYLGLTGARLKAADMIYAGVATSFVASEKLNALLDELAGAGSLDHNSVDAIIAKYAGEPGPAPIADMRALIDRTFNKGTVEEIVEALSADGSDEALKMHKILGLKSPTSMKLTCRQLHEGANKNFNEGMVMEFRIVNRIMLGHDFYEGVRAVIVDKDNQPNWQPDSLGQISDADIDVYFRPLETDIVFA